MLQHAIEATEFLNDKSRADLDNNRMLTLALIRLLEIVGEAATRISPETCGKYPSIPWSDIIGLRNRLIHGYDRVDLDILWNIVTSDLPPLIEALESGQDTT
jgi:uncharacterized protein with HEPN domain